MPSEETGALKGKVAWRVQRSCLSNFSFIDFRKRAADRRVRLKAEATRSEGIGP